MKIYVTTKFIVIGIIIIVIIFITDNNIFRSYLRYKRKTSQKVSSEAQVKIFLIS